LSRPRIQKRICDVPSIDTFTPSGMSSASAQTVTMSVEEYEALRLIDYEDLSQEQCAQIMGVARSTVQRLYNDARKKIADSIINVKVLKIGGGDYTICLKKQNQSLCTGCKRHQHRRGGNRES
jgi:uncharacterized protein